VTSASRAAQAHNDSASLARRAPMPYHARLQLLVSRRASARNSAPLPAHHAPEECGDGIEPKRDHELDNSCHRSVYTRGRLGQGWSPPNFGPISGALTSRNTDHHEGPAGEAGQQEREPYEICKTSIPGSNPGGASKIIRKILTTPRSPPPHSTWSLPLSVGELLASDLRG
jgi:hypothetical protein